MEKFGEFVITLISSSSIIAAVALFSKNIIAYFLSSTIEVKKMELAQELESYKQGIQQENSEFQHDLNEKLQEHRGKLELINREFDIRFSRMHQERADVIKKVYKYLAVLHGAMTDFTQTMHFVIEDAEKESQVRIDNVNKSLHRFVNYYVPNKIFLSKSLCEKIDHIIKQYRDKGWDFAATQRAFKETPASLEDYKAEIAKAKEISRAVKDEMPILIEELEAEFRLILGVDDKTVVD